MSESPQTQEFPYLMGIKAWNMLLLSLCQTKSKFWKNKQLGKYTKCYLCP